MMKPNFFIVGAPKCGTSSMWRYLDSHPDVFMSRWKEPHFFSRNDLPWSRAGWGVEDKKDYLRLFANANGASRIGEASTWYLCSTTAAKRIAAFAPEAKIICMLRDPVAMVCSMFHQNVSNGNEDIFDLGKALAAEAERKNGNQVPEHAPYAADFYYFHSACYAEQLQRYFDSFGRDNVLVLLFDDLVRDTPAIYQRTLEFLRVDSGYRPDFSVVNAKRPIRNQRIRRFLLARPRLAGALDRRVPAEVRGVVGKALGAFGRRNSVVPVISSETTSALRTRFEPQVSALESLLGRDLSAWRMPR